MNKIAQEYENPLLGGLKGESGSGFFAKVLPSLIGLFYVIGAVLFVIIMILGGIRWITAGGDKAAVEQSRGMITNAIIGIVILFSTYVIIQLVEAFFGINIININIGALKIS